MTQFTRINIRINGKEVANEVNEILKAKRELNKEINRMTIGSEEYIEATRELANVNERLNEHRRAIGNSSNASQVLSTNLKGVGAAALAAFSVDAIIGFGREIFKSAVSLDTLQRKAQTVFGSSISIVEQFADSMSQSLGQSKGETIAAATSIGDLLIPMGFARDQAAVLSTGLVNMSGALSEWTGGQKSAKEVSETLTKALLGEREELKGLGISITEEDVKTRLAAEGKAKLTGNALQQAKALATLALITEKSADAQTAFANNSDSLVRSQARLTASMATIKENLANALIPFFAKAAGAVSDLIAPHQAASEGVMRLQSAFNLEMQTLKNSNVSAENRKVLIGQINAKYKEYLPSLLSEKDSIADITEKQNAGNKAFREKITLMAAEESFIGAQKKMLNAKREEIDLVRQLEAEKARFSETTNKPRAKFDKNETGAYLNEQAAQTLQAAQAAVAANKKLQDEAQADYDKTMSAATALGVNVAKIGNSVASSTPLSNMAKAEKSKLPALLDELEDIYKKHLQEVELLRVSDFEKGLLQINQKYEAEKEKERENVAKFEGTVADKAKATAKLNELLVNLDKFRDEEKLRYSDEYRKKGEEEADKAASEESEKKAARNAKDLEESKKFLEERAKSKAEFEKGLTDKFALESAEDPFAKYQKELDLLLAFYQESKLLADEHGISVTQITADYEAKKAEITARGQKAVADTAQQAAQKRIDSFNAEIAALQSAFEGFGQVFGAMAELIGSEGEANAEFTKALTLFQIAMDTASAIASLTKMSSANPANAATSGIAGVIQFTTGLAQILTNIARAKKLLTAEPPKKQKYMGGFEDVTGATDGKKYTARNIGQPSTGLLNFNTPVLTANGILANEKGREYYISAQDVRNPYVMKRIDEIEAFKHGGRTVVAKQFAEGGYNTTAIAPVTGTSNADVLFMLSKIHDLLASQNITVVNKWTDDDTIALQKKGKDLQAVSGGKYSFL